MRVKKFLALMMVVAMAGAFVVPTANVKAEGLTQVQDPNKVKYGVVTEEEKALLKTVFDAEYYLKCNPDLAKIFGNDFDKLFEHFSTVGVFECRACNPNFDPSAYSSAYPDLKESFGLNILKYYTHYATVGVAENRTLTTLEACANAGISVTTLSEYSVTITPEIYKIATIDMNHSHSSNTQHYISGSIYVYVDSSNNYAAYSDDKYLESSYDFDTNKTTWSNRGEGVDFVEAPQVISGTNYTVGGETVQGILVYKTSEDYDASTAVQVGAFRYRVSEPIPVQSILAGEMPSGGADTVLYAANSDDEIIQTTGSTYRGQYTDGWGTNYNDPLGSADTDYDLSMKIESTEDGKAVATVSISNEENKYATVLEFELTKLETQSNASSSTPATTTSGDTSTSGDTASGDSGAGDQTPSGDTIGDEQTP